METSPKNDVGEIEDTFKSYYVVWKLFGFFATNRASAGLNRTMQYGNKNIYALSFKIIRFKSYYVVWKQNSKGEVIGDVDSLNRTMQYGN